MNSFIISSKNFDAAKNRANKIAEENKIDKFEREEDIFEKALGIEDVRNIQKKIFLKPFRGSKKLNTLILKKGASVQAQNAMLKLLEEPPDSSVIILITDNYHAFIPTVLSRVKIIEVNEDRHRKSGGLAQIIEILDEGDSLYLAQDIGKDKDKAIIWLEDTILETREKMLENLDNKEETLKLKKLISNLEIAQQDLKNTNVNTRLALENLFLNI